MAAEGVPIAYTALEKGVPVMSRTGTQFGTVEHVLQIPEEDLFDGIVVRTKEGLRFVDRDCVDQITTARVTCSLNDSEVQNLPQPSAPPSYSADATADSGKSLHDVFGRMFGRAHWTQDRDQARRLCRGQGAIITAWTSGAKHVTVCGRLDSSARLS